jgi:hypothetical protein
MTVRRSVPTKLPPGIILVAHQVVRTISQTEMLSALPEAYAGLPRHVATLDSVSSTLSGLTTFDWGGARAKQEREYREKLKPLIDQNPGWRVQYFGAAPIPLAIHLGFLVGGFPPIDVYLARHDTHEWAWTGFRRSIRFKTCTLPADRSRLYRNPRAISTSNS